MAIERPHIGRFSAQRVVLIHVETTRDGMGPAIHSAIEEISRVLQGQSIAPAGPWFTHHHRRPSETFDFDVCFPVSGEVSVSGRLQAEALAEREVVRTAYHGSYAGLPHAWPELLAWAERQNYTIDGDFYEIYSIGPRDTPEAERWQTDLMVPLKHGEAGKERIV